MTAVDKYTAIGGMESLALLGVGKGTCESSCAGAGVQVPRGICVCPCRSVVSRRP